MPLRSKVANEHRNTGKLVSTEILALRAILPHTLTKKKKPIIQVNPLPHTPYFDAPEKVAFRKHCGKRRKCW